MDYLLDEIMCKLCGVSCYLDKNISLEYLNTIEKCFGIFLSVKREGKIYGCLGSWDTQYNILDASYMYNMIHSLCDSIAQGNDIRSSTFTTPITDDPNTKIEIYFMLLPLYQPQLVKNNDNYLYFNNDVYGIIYQKDNKKATFLPGVFGVIRYDIITSSLISKTGINSVNQLDLSQSQFIAYKSYVISKSFGRMV